MEILVFSRDGEKTKLLCAELAAEEYGVSEAHDDETGLNAIQTNPPDLVLFDITPDAEDLVLCRQMRRVSEVPIMILADKSGVSDRIAGLDSGADDYMVKPYAEGEHLSRIRALLRRKQTPMSVQQRLAVERIYRDVWARREERPN